MENKLLENLKILNSLNTQRINWIKVSLILILLAGISIIFWEKISQSYLMWPAVAFGISIALVWWFWTMDIIRKLIFYKVAESQMLVLFVKDIKELREEIEEMLESNPYYKK